MNLSLENIWTYFEQIPGLILSKYLDLSWANKWSYLEKIPGLICIIILIHISTGPLSVTKLCSSCIFILTHLILELNSDRMRKLVKQIIIPFIPDGQGALIIFFCDHMTLVLYRNCKRSFKSTFEVLSDSVPRLSLCKFIIFNCGFSLKRTRRVMLQKEWGKLSKGIESLSQTMIF